MIARRKFLGLMLAAPAIVRASSLMAIAPVREVPLSISKLRAATAAMDRLAVTEIPGGFIITDAFIQQFSIGVREMMQGRLGDLGAAP